MNFTDLRILKTQERLQNALLELLETKELKAITVKEICDKAAAILADILLHPPGNSPGQIFD